VSYTIVRDDFVAIESMLSDQVGKAFPALHIRAVISTRVELQELIEKLNRRLETDFAQEEKTDDRSASEQPAAVPAQLSANDNSGYNFWGE